MTEETTLGSRERARLVGRAVLTVGFASAVFCMWLAIGLPSIPGLHFGSPSAHADDGVVVHIAHRPGAAFAPSLLLAHAATPTASRKHHPATAVISKSLSEQPQVSAAPASQPQSDAPAPSSPAASPQSGSPAPQAPADGSPAPAAAPVSSAPTQSTQPTQPAQTVSTPTVPIPVDLPPLPVQVPAVTIPQVVPPLPALPSLPPLPPPPLPPVVSKLVPPGLP